MSCVLCDNTELTERTVTVGLLFLRDLHCMNNLTKHLVIKCSQLSTKNQPLLNLTMENDNEREKERFIFKTFDKSLLNRSTHKLITNGSGYSFGFLLTGHQLVDILYKHGVDLNVPTPITDDIGRGSVDIKH